MKDILKDQKWKWSRVRIRVVWRVYFGPFLLGVSISNSHWFCWEHQEIWNADAARPSPKKWRHFCFHNLWIVCLASIDHTHSEHVSGISSNFVWPVRVSPMSRTFYFSRVRCSSDFLPFTLILVTTFLSPSNIERNMQVPKECGVDAHRYLAVEQRAIIIREKTLSISETRT